MNPLYNEYILIKMKKIGKEKLQNWNEYVFN
jgi:hypothetical protein